jgi:hypothetical protein
VARERVGGGRFALNIKDGLRWCAGCEEWLPLDLEHFGVRSWADKDRREVRYWKNVCRGCCARRERERIERLKASPKAIRAKRRSETRWKDGERRRAGSRRMSPDEYRRRFKKEPPPWTYPPFDPQAYIDALSVLVAPDEPDPIEATSEGGGGALCGHSSADTDYECVHGRIAGDRCPQPEFVPGNGKPVPNLDRRWPHDHPCDCWGGR